MAIVRGLRIRHARMGRLVQPSPAALAHRQHLARGSRGAILCHDRTTTYGRVTQTKQPPANPARFIFTSIPGSTGWASRSIISAAFSKSCDRQCMIWVVWTSYCCANSASVRSPFTAASAPFALNVGLCLWLVLFATSAPLPRSSPWTRWQSTRLLRS
jgi:hypothetical protein